MRKCAWQEAGDRNYMSQARSAAHIQSFMGAEVHRLPQKIVSSVGETYGCPTGHPVKKIKENSLICRNRGEVFAASARRKFPAIITIRERSEEHTSELQSLMRSSYAVFCLKKKKKRTHPKTTFQ